MDINKALFACSNCKKACKNDDIFHIIINKGIPLIIREPAHYDENKNIEYVKCNVIYDERKINSVYTLCKECLNKMKNSMDLLYKEDKNEPESNN